jgi:hypothetical protein
MRHILWEVPGELPMLADAAVVRDGGDDGDHGMVAGYKSAASDRAQRP